MKNLNLGILTIILVTSAFIMGRYSLKPEETGIIRHGVWEIQQANGYVHICNLGIVIHKDAIRCSLTTNNGLGGSNIYWSDPNKNFSVKTSPVRISMMEKLKPGSVTLKSGKVLLCLHLEIQKSRVLCQMSKSWSSISAEEVKF